jgi:hypothetical protein
MTVADVEAICGCPQGDYRSVTVQRKDSEDVQCWEWDDGTMFVMFDGGRVILKATLPRPENNRFLDRLLRLLPW